MESYRNLRRLARQEGFRGVCRRHGLKAAAALFAFFLVKGIVLYIWVPYLLSTA